MGRYDYDNSTDARKADVGTQIDYHVSTLQEEIDGDGYVGITRPMGGAGAPMPTAGGRGADDE